ncbi:hypothetical protein PGT21_000006, partial [Puccinia graminis f. sp. tritici]
MSSPSPPAASQAFPCNKESCPLTFPSKNQVKKHMRLAHQPHVSCTIFGTKEIVILDRQDNHHFNCPTRGCQVSTEDPVKIQRHVKNCDPAEFDRPRVMQLPPRDFVTLVQPGDQLVVLPEHPRLAYNKYADIIICTTCHTGLDTPEVQAHMLNAHKEKVRQEDIILNFYSHGFSLPATAPKYPVSRSGQDSIKNHFRLEHTDSNGHWKDNCKRSYVQHLVHKKRYLRGFVIPAAPPVISGILEGVESMPQTGDTPLTERWEQLKDALSNLD